MKILVTLVLMTLVYHSVLSQDISSRAHVGYSRGQGEFFEDLPDDVLAAFSLYAAADLFIHNRTTDNKLAMGANASYTILSQEFESDFDELSQSFHLARLGFITKYRFLNSSVSPYLAMTIGAVFFYAEDANAYGNNYEKLYDFGVGIVPEFGIDFGNAFLNINYQIPTNFRLETAEGEEVEFNIGVLQVGLGVQIGNY